MKQNQDIIRSNGWFKIKHDGILKVKHKTHTHTHKKTDVSIDINFYNAVFVMQFMRICEYECVRPQYHFNIFKNDINRLF